MTTEQQPRALQQKLDVLPRDVLWNGLIWGGPCHPPGYKASPYCADRVKDARLQQGRLESCSHHNRVPIGARWTTLVELREANALVLPVKDADFADHEDVTQQRPVINAAV